MRYTGFFARMRSRRPLACPAVQKWALGNFSLVSASAADRGQEMDFAIFLDSLEHSYGADFSVYGDGYVWFEFEAVDEADFHARVGAVEVVDHFADGIALYWDGGLAVREFLHQWGDENRWHLTLPRGDSPGLPRRLRLYYSVSSGRAHGVEVG